MTDEANDVTPIVQSRVGIKNYYTTKTLTCFAGGFVAFFIPLAINILLNLLIFPQSGITAFGDMFDRNFSPTVVGANVIVDAITKGIAFPKLFLFSADVYNAVFAVNYANDRPIYSGFINLMLPDSEYLAFVNPLVINELTEIKRYRIESPFFCVLNLTSDYSKPVNKPVSETTYNDFGNSEFFCQSEATLNRLLEIKRSIISTFLP
jgi:hypothetical protein